MIKKENKGGKVDGEIKDHNITRPILLLKICLLIYQHLFVQRNLAKSFSYHRTRQVFLNYTSHCQASTCQLITQAFITNFFSFHSFPNSEKHSTNLEFTLIPSWGGNFWPTEAIKRSISIFAWKKKKSF